MTQHMWVALSYQPIDVDVDENGVLHTYTTEIGEELAREDSALVCWICLVHLNTDTHDTECPGSQNILAGDLDTDAGSPI